MLGNNIFKKLIWRRFLTSSSRRFQRSSIFLPSLFKSCRSCGIKLQSIESNEPGFFIDPKPKIKLLKNEDQVFNKYLSKLSDEDKKLLLNDLGESTVSKAKILDEEEVDVTNLECIRCRDAKFKSKYKMNEFPVKSFDSIISSIPPNGKIIYIVNAQDFPFSINPSIFNYRKPSEVKFIVNKVDLLFRNVSLSNKYGLRFMQDYLFRKYKASPENVIVSSGLSNWNMNQILNFIEDDSYLIGNVNSGKSTIINSLLYYYEKNKPKYISSRERTKLEKQEDRLINHLSKSRAKVLKREEEKFKRTKGSGVSFMPGFTRENIQYEIGLKTVYDVPGFTTHSGHGIYNMVDPKIMKSINKGSKVFKNGSFDSKYQTVKGGQCLSVGGLLYLQVPQDSMFQVRNCINFEFKVFSSFEKATNILNNLEQNESLARYFIVEKTTLQDLQKYVIPPFYGSIDLVIRNLGHINLTPTGKMNTNEPVVLYLPAGVEALVRQPITKYISKTLAGRDSAGNPLKKENWVSKSVTHLKRYNGENPFYSKLIPVKEQEDHYKAISKYLTKIRSEDIKFDKDTTVSENSKYKYWLEI